MKWEQKYVPRRVGTQCLAQNQPWQMTSIMGDADIMTRVQVATITFFGMLLPLPC